MAIESVEINDPSAGITPALLESLKSKYPSATIARLADWKQLILQNQKLSIQEKLTLVNNFFNDKQRIQYAPDILVWNQYDYWASPVEFLIKGMGDCEDYAIAKFFTLLALGVPQDKLKMTFVYLTAELPGVNKDLAHMVLSYYDTPSSIPLILDNGYDTIELATNRPELRPVMTFNGVELWEKKQREKGVRSPKDIKPWVEMNERSLNILGGL